MKVIKPKSWDKLKFIIFYARKNFDYLKKKNNSARTFMKENNLSILKHFLTFVHFEPNI